MIPFTIVMAYYENPGMLQKHYDTWRQMSSTTREHLSAVVVDDGSPTQPAFLPPPNYIPGMDIELYRIKIDVRWNQDAARNIGVRHTKTKWVLLTDIDHLVPEKTVLKIQSAKLEEANAYKFSRVSAPELLPYKIHPNSWLMTKKLYDQCGGYDERFAGYYGTDSDFRNRVEQNARSITILKQTIIRVPREVIPDASTTTYQRKAPEDRPNLDRIKAERALLADQTPIRYRFAYERVTHV